MVAFLFLRTKNKSNVWLKIGQLLWCYFLCFYWRIRNWCAVSFIILCCFFFLPFKSFNFWFFKIFFFAGRNEVQTIYVIDWYFSKTFSTIWCYHLVEECIRTSRQWCIWFTYGALRRVSGDLMLISLTLEQPVPNHGDWNQVYR